MLLVGSEEIGSRTGHEAGRELLSRLYEEYTGTPMPEIAVADRGKPYFVNSPLHFSISHTKRHVFCALSDTPVGIDAEELDRKITPRLAEKILSPTEKLQYGQAEDQDRALLTFWVLKEAWVKYTGEGLRGYPNDTNFSLNDPAVTVKDGCLLAVLRKD